MSVTRPTGGFASECLSSRRLRGLGSTPAQPAVQASQAAGDAGHDLEERYPTYRYDMDDIFVTPDGTVWLSTGYHDSDNEAYPRAGSCGRSGSLGRPVCPSFFCFAEGFGVKCVDTP